MFNSKINFQSIIKYIFQFYISIYEIISIKRKPMCRVGQ